jgi:hypothetical protein
MFVPLLFHLLSAIPLSPTFPVLYFEAFNGPADDWFESVVPNYSRAWSVGPTEYPQTHEGERALIESTGRGRSAVSTRFQKRINVANKTFVLQYEMRAQYRYRCLSAGLKLFSDPQFDPTTLTNETAYTIMFGPDVCAFSRVSFELGYKNPETNRIEIHNFTDSPRAPKDRTTHLYTLIIRPDATFSILIDNELEKEGNLFYDLAPGLPRGAAQTGLDKKPAEFTGIGFEVFDVDFNLAYSKILIADDEAAVKKFNEESFVPRRKAQLEAPSEADLNELELAQQKRTPGPTPNAGKKTRQKIGFLPTLAKSGAQLSRSFQALIKDVPPLAAVAAAAVFLTLLLCCCCCCCCGREAKRTEKVKTN